MPLDKLTLHSQLALYEQNAASLDSAIAQKTKTLQDASIDLERTRGARGYHDLIVQQLHNALAEIERTEKATEVERLAATK